MIRGSTCLEENMALTKVEVHFWVIKFHKKGLIHNYTIPKRAVRDLFYKERTKYTQEYIDLIVGLKKHKFILADKDVNLIFKPEKLVEILNENAGIKSIDKGEKIKLVHECEVCLAKFSHGKQFNDHLKNDMQHHFRTLYLHNSPNLKISSRDIKIEVTKGSGSERELLLLNGGDKILTNIYISNLSRTSYLLTSVVELHQNINTIRIDTRNLPIWIYPNGQVTLCIRSSMNKPVTMLFVHVFNFKNASNREELDVVKEISVHVNADTSKEVVEVPTATYVKRQVVRNGINPRWSIPAKIAMPYENYTVELGKYAIPMELERLLAAGLKAYNGMKHEGKKYLDFITSLVPENNPRQQALSKTNYWHLLDLLVHMEEYQISIDVRNYDTVTRNLVRVPGYNDRFQLQVPELAERRPSLLPGDFVYVRGENTKTYQGVVRFLHQDSVILEFSKAFSRDIYTAGISLSVTYGYNRSNIRTEHRSIDLLGQHRVLTPFFPSKVSITSVKEYNLDWFNPKIESNPQQQQAIIHILNRSSYPSPYLIFGPPGTGKTMTIVEAISQVWKTKPAANILVCAPSNSVANEIALRLTDYVPKTQLFRYMSISYGMFDIPDKVLPFTNYDEKEFYHPSLQEICSYRIVISTLSTSSKLVSLGVPAKHFAYVFIDESGHATETETLIPIAGLLTDEEYPGSMLGQVVLAGDPQQLGPIIHSPYAKHYGFGVSMLERLMTTIDVYEKDSSGKYNPMMLTKLLLNYRSHPSILYLPNKLFYETELIPKADDLVNIALNWNMLPNKQMPIIFHSVIGTDQREDNSPSYFNPQEVEMVMKYLNDLVGKRLNGRTIAEEDIGVIAPYRKQVQKIRRACEQKQWNKLTIGSVEQFQGQERLIIIISTVRSKPKLLKFDNKFHLGFLNNPKRFNVAITRAKALVIVIGNPNLLQYETYWRMFIQYCMDNRCMLGEPFNFSLETADLLALDMAKLRINGQPDDSADFSRGNI